MYQVRRKVLLLLLTLALTTSAWVQAAVLEGFYRVEIPAGEDEELDRGQALREAFELMITRQAGSEAAESEAVLAAMQDPRNFMRRIAGTETGGVRVEFEPASLRDLLTEAGLPILGPNRPAVMLWAVESGDIGEELLGQDSDWAAALGEAAEYRAVALSLPMADLEDRSLVDVQTIQDADGSTLKRASERYDASAVLALSIEEGSNGPALEWSWWLNEQTDSGRITAGSKAAAADKLMLAVADLVLDQYAVMPADDDEVSSWEVVVEGIDSLDEFAALQRTLQQVGSKQMPSVLSIRGDQVRLALEFPGSEAQLERLLALDQRLRRVPAPEPESEPEPVSGPIADSQPDEAAGVDAGESAGLRAAGESAALDFPSALESSEPETAPNMMYFRWR